MNPFEDDELTVPVRADLSAFEADLVAATRLADRFGTAIGGAFEGAILKGKAFGDVLRELALRLSRLALDAALKPLEQSLSAGILGLVGGALPFARGGAFSGGEVVSQPTLFGLSGGRRGVMGEAGPEAVLPLARGADGRLGVQAGAGGAVTINFNVTSPDAGSFRAAEGQIQALLARAAARGRRNL
ncbi:phage tail tape measure protein [Lutibaculum baratangense]|uniref:Phage-related minor tail protein n=1 Tax=Lutibaculum baratangense AMV1 TaxID=631454 RepID=V4RHQ6_9HYPH|nr:phage tail tape measure protein [Lutibaculum baratangense]ESR22800.1 Phage-related minor tail protein [Lutibaculum baratangense AMV1]